MLVHSRTNILLFGILIGLAIEKADIDAGIEVSGLAHGSGNWVEESTDSDAGIEVGGRPGG